MAKLESVCCTDERIHDKVFWSQGSVHCGSSKPSHPGILTDCSHCVLGMDDLRGEMGNLCEVLRSELNRSVIFMSWGIRGGLGPLDPFGFRCAVVVPLVRIVMSGYWACCAV